MASNQSQEMSETVEYVPVWRIPKLEPGEIYIMEDRGRYKIGKTNNIANRMKEARTWLPEIVLIGHKPFWSVSEIEKQLHLGFSFGWKGGEWFEFEFESDLQLLIEGFLAFSDSNRDMNSVNFIYWFNGEGMAEFVREQARQKLSRTKFLKQETVHQSK